ncbi:uncharacterized protein EDB93DRAFT_1251067 [Suillus bovinus]|uniref:uncharacterized protein n=1 Tax=Suillus bovinus TaxID=48563 RepID=UPI001B872187|nr:uncharacterized protein EDB93DRAFT_1251067 [Suillus bovinus]KAG2146099.1 hypothetical protein EDB93DRAFT_1251067 [Suillus bovinus]
MPTTNLPVELWLLIVSFSKISSNDMAVLCRVCAGLYDAVVDSLYESITVDNSDVCTTLAECPHLAKKVKSFVFTYPTIMVHDGPKVHLDNLTLALKNMTCLSTLKLIHSKKHEYSSVLQYCDAKLHLFHCTYDVNRQFLSFLNRQDNIRNLALAGLPTIDIYPTHEEMFLPTSLPHLSEVSADPCFLNDLVQGCPVHTVCFKGQHLPSSDMRLRDFIDPSTILVKNLGLDLMIWEPVVIHCAPLSKDIEEITLTGLVAQQHPTNWSQIYGIDCWRCHFDGMLAGAQNLKRLMFWFKGKHEDARSWAQLLFQEFHDTLSRLEHVSCVVAGPDTSMLFDFLSGCPPIPHEDNRTRGHRAANDVWKLMLVPVLCCWTEENLCDIHSLWTMPLAPRAIEPLY